MGKEQSSVVEIIVNKQIYKISCDEGQEEHIQNCLLYTSPSPRDPE